MALSPRSWKGLFCFKKLVTASHVKIGDCPTDVPSQSGPVGLGLFLFLFVLKGKAKTRWFEGSLVVSLAPR